MWREGQCIGAISVVRDTPGLFSEAQVTLVHTLADQAAIAIEKNVRLFIDETKEALEQQTATGEILRVIASSPTDLQPVMEAVAENAARVCGATDSSIFRLGRGAPPPGGTTWIAAQTTGDRRILTRHSRLRIRTSCVRPAATIHVADIRAAEAEFPQLVSGNRQAGSFNRTMLATPLLRGGVRRWVSS